MKIMHGDKICAVCGNKLNEFLPGGADAEIFKKHHIIGGGYRENCLCPCCKSSDRERWLCWVLKNKTDISQISGKIIHFAPEKAAVNYIKQNNAIDYYTCDIVPGRAMYIADMLAIPYENETFDYAICNHVMEHIVNEKGAVSEIKRVLKKNGKWIFSFPICTDMRTYDDKAVISPKDRLKEYGQEDHVRLYGNDYLERFQSYGLELQVISPEKELEDKDIHKFGFIKDDVILIAKKTSYRKS